MTRTFSDEQILVAAQAGHNINRAYCLEIGDWSQTTWGDAPQLQRDSAIEGVKAIVALGGHQRPEASHEGWLRQKEREGWKYGPVRDPAKKEHPCFVPYSQLPPAQKAKDTIFVAVVCGVLGLPDSDRRTDGE